MRRTNALPLALMAALIIPALAWAFDLGGSIDANTVTNKIGTAEFSMTESDKASLWIMHNFTDDISISAKGNYKLTINDIFLPTFDPAINITNTGDLDSLVFYLSAANALGDKSRFKLWVGRTTFADFSGEIINHKLDGLSVGLSFPGLDWKIGVGTSALLFRHSSGLFSSSKDFADIAAWTAMSRGAIPFDAARALVDPKIILVNSLSFPQVFLGQTLDIGLVGQVDLDPLQVAATATPAATDRVAVDTGYFGLGLSGKLAGPLYWNMYSWLEMGYTLSNINNVYTPTLILSNADSLRFTLYLSGLANSVLDLGGKFGLGDTTANALFADTNNAADFANTFTPISFRGVAVIFNPQLGNIVQADLGFSIKPFSGLPGAMKDFSVEVRGFTFIRPFLGPISEGLVAKTTEQYLATEVDLNLSWRPISDLGISGSFGALFANTAALKRPATEMKANLALSLSF